MTTPLSINTHFKQKLQEGQQLLGCFVKTPHPILIEVLGVSGLDFLVLDAEHAPFDRTTIDVCLIAGRSVGCPILVRVPNDEPAFILNVLDGGAAGVMVPHVKSVEQAYRLSRSVHYVPGGRGYAGTTRAAYYGQRHMSDHKPSTQQEVTLICQIEDPEGVEQYQKIAALDGVDVLFVGRADLAVAHDYDDFRHDHVEAQCREVLGANSCRTGLFCTPGEDLTRWEQAGATFFVVGSDHAFLSQGIQHFRKSVLQ